MKNRKQYFVAEYILDFHFMEDEYSVFLADSEEAVLKYMDKHFGKHLIACYVRKATWAERRNYKKHPLCTAVI
jgi:hypothetical protein